MHGAKRVSSGLAIALAAGVLSAADWPEWRGTGRRGVWNEAGIVSTLPDPPLRVTWRSPVRPGYSGPAVAAGRVFLLDHQRSAGTQATERALCLEERTGRLLWTREWPADYRGLDYPNGPRATPTVDGGRLYVLGAMGALLCLRVQTGEVIWSKDYVRDYRAVVPAWGMSSAPLVDGPRLFVVAAGDPNAKVLALDKRTGREIWRALSSEDSEPGYSQPILVQAGGRRQLIIWHAGALVALEPESGKVLWEQPFRVRMNTPIATHAWDPPHLLVSAFFNGARMMELDAARPGARLLWAGKSESETSSDTLHALMSQPFIEGGFIYGACSYGQLRCLKRLTGERVWESQQAAVERARNVTVWLVKQADRYFIWNDRGELILARLSPAGYQELGRASVLKPTSPAPGRRQLAAVSWAHPAFANLHMVARNDEEVIRVSLAENDYDVTRPSR